MGHPAVHSDSISAVPDARLASQHKVPPLRGSPLSRWSAPVGMTEITELRRSEPPSQNRAWVGQPAVWSRPRWWFSMMWSWELGSSLAWPSLTYDWCALRRMTTRIQLNRRQSDVLRGKRGPSRDRV